MGRDYRQQATRAANLLKVTKALQECPKSVSRDLHRNRRIGDDRLAVVQGTSRLWRRLHRHVRAKSFHLGGRVVARNWHGCKDAAPANKTGTPGIRPPVEGKAGNQANVNRQVRPSEITGGFLNSGPARTFRLCPDRST